MYGFDDFVLSKLFFRTIKSHEFKNKKLNKSINKKIYYTNSDKAIFILPHWMGKTFYFKPMTNRLKNKYTIILYDLPYNLLSNDVTLTVNLSKKIANDIKSTFDKLQKNGCKTYSIIGTSTSCVIAAMIANRDSRCKRLVFNLVGNDLAECMWYSNNPLVTNIKNNLINKGITLNKLKNHFKIMSYKKNSSNLNKKDILIFLSKNDKIIPYHTGIKLLGLLNQDNIKYGLVKHKFFGHYISGFKNIIFSNKIINFLEKR